MKIGILTFYYCCNPGAVLQAYALYTILKSYTNDVQFINYKLPCLVQRYKVFIAVKYILKGHLLSKMWKAAINTFIFYSSRKQQYKSFRNKFLIESIDLNTTPYDHIIIGSDQVWNTFITHGADNFYWGYFEKGENTKVSTYAASCIPEVDMKDTCFIQNRMTFFDNISVRERDTQKRLNEIGIKNELVLDPVFLLPKETWLTLVSQKKLSYICEYNIQGLPLSKEICNYIKGIKHIKHILSPIMNHHWVSKSPQQFLSTIYNSSIVITSSFHGLAFSIIFEKDFIVVKSGTQKDNRLLSLLHQIGLDHRAVSTIEQTKQTIQKDIDWQTVKRRLNKDINTSLNYLNKCIYD